MEVGLLERDIIIGAMAGSERKEREHGGNPRSGGTGISLTLGACVRSELAAWGMVVQFSRLV